MLNHVAETGVGPQVDLLRQDSHFAFGKNWESYAKLIKEAQIENAVANLRRLHGGDLTGKRFLDIGCGSGLHSLAALRLAAREVVSVDIDPDAVATTRRVLGEYAAGKTWKAFERSVFDLDPSEMGLFDIVYSWGVLHHTGDMNRALRSAAGLVAPGGQFIFALYHRTRLCGFWKAEKRWYAAASPRSQRLARSLYVMLYRLRKGRGFADYVAGYETKRGMDFQHDVHDWLGGWPYESTSPAQVDALMRQLDMQKVLIFEPKRSQTGVFGTGCDQYVYARR